jgi:hypothetical protein
LVNTPRLLTLMPWKVDPTLMIEDTAAAAAAAFCFASNSAMPLSAYT